MDDDKWKVIAIAEIMPNILEGAIDISDIPTHMCLGAYGGGRTTRNYVYDPYFKCGNAKSLDKSTKIARISIFRPEYIVHNNEKWNMGDSEKKALMKLLTTTHRGMTIWEDLLWEIGKVISKENSNIDQEYLNKIYDAPLPNYMDLHYMIKGVRKERI